MGRALVHVLVESICISFGTPLFDTLVGDETEVALRDTISVNGGALGESTEEDGRALGGVKCDNDGALEAGPYLFFVSFSHKLL